MSPPFLFSVLLLCCSAAYRSHDFTLCSKLAHWSDVISTPSKYISTQESLTYLHSLPCLNICFNRKILPIPRSTPTFKLALILLLSGDVNLNPGPFTVSTLQHLWLISPRPTSSHIPENIYQNCTNSTIKYLKHCLTNMHPLKLNLCRKNRQLPG